VGKRKFATTAIAQEWKHDYSHYANTMTVHTRGWELGVEVVCAIEDGQEVFHVYKTQGSNGGSKRELFAELKGDDVILTMH